MRLLGSLCRDAWLPMLGAAALVGILLGTRRVTLVRLEDVTVVLLGLSAVALLGTVCGRQWTGDAKKAGLVGLVILLALSTPGSASEALRSANLLGVIGGDLMLVVLWVLATIVTLQAVRRSNRSLVPVVQAVALGLGALVVFNGVRVLGSLGRPAQVKPEISTQHVSRSTRPPDIYLIVVDKYTGSRVLHTAYGFDNGAFETWLRSRGFVVPAAPRANYVQTVFALASLLNFQYLDHYTTRFGREARDRSGVLIDIENNALAAFLQRQGYRFVFLPAAYMTSRENRYADLQLPSPHEIQPEFLSAWYRTTALPILHRLGCEFLGCDATRRPYIPESAELLEWKLEQLPRLADSTRPTFVFAHILLPHEPYLFRADCSRRPPFWPEYDHGRWASVVAKAYVEQVQCLNRRLMQAVEAIQRDAAVPPIILIQGDHGHGRMGHPVRPLTGISPEVVAERRSVFAAYAIPETPADSFPPDITPVNAVRLMLRRTFGADLPPLPNRTYWSATHQPFDFEPIY